MQGLTLWHHSHQFVFIDWFREPKVAVCGLSVVFFLTGWFLSHRFVFIDWFREPKVAFCRPLVHLCAFLKGWFLSFFLSFIWGYLLPPHEIIYLSDKKITIFNLYSFKDVHIEALMIWRGWLTLDPKQQMLQHSIYSVVRHIVE